VKRLRPRVGQALKCAAVLVAIAPLVPAVQVACLRFSDPTMTAPMAWRWMRGKLSGQPMPPVRYQPVPLRDVPPTFLTCVWLAEDMRFFQHHGFDWKEIRVALEQAHASGRPARGASTITQQCARSLFLWHGRSWLRKGLEAYYTAWMESLLSKKRILELYVNAIELGNGIYGLEAAAQCYYDVHARDLNLDQVTLMVAILPKPRSWNPQSPDELVLKRQAMILKRSESRSLPLELIQ
jgi:monofunctional glycosyltransferase